MESVIIRFSECTEQEIEKHFTDLKVETMQTILKHTLCNARICYPTFDYWLDTKVSAQLSNGKRDILFLFDKENPRQVLGLAVLKLEEEEKKICSFRIEPPNQRKGLGRILMQECFKVLGTNKPMLTVPRDMSLKLSDPNNCYSAFNSFLSKHFKDEFELTQKAKDYYRNGYTEYVYNGLLPPKIDVLIK